SVVLLSLAPPLGAATRPITETDLFRFTWIADPQISPDGRRVAFVRVTVDAKKTGYETAIWTVDTDGSHPPRSFTAGPRDRARRLPRQRPRLPGSRPPGARLDGGGGGGRGQAGAAAGHVGRVRGDRSRLLARRRARVLRVHARAGAVRLRRGQRPLLRARGGRRALARGEHRGADQRVRAEPGLPAGCLPGRAGGPGAAPAPPGRALPWGAPPPRRLTRLNESLLSELRLSAPEEIVYPSFDGRQVQAWILKPPDYDPARRYPLILNIHGGPHAAYGATFDHEFQWMAARGYVV